MGKQRSGFLGLSFILSASTAMSWSSGRKRHPGWGVVLLGSPILVFELHVAFFFFLLPPGAKVFLNATIFDPCI